MMMRRLLVAGVTSVLACLTAAAEDKPARTEAQPLNLVLPANTKECLATLEAVVERAIEADLLDDQVDETEAHLEKLETACQEGRFAEALAEAKAVEKILLTNK